MRFHLRRAAPLQARSTLENTAQAAAVSLDADSAWTLTGDSYVTVLTNVDETCANIVSGGHNLYYDADAAGNEWLGAQTIAPSRAAAA